MSVSFEASPLCRRKHILTLWFQFLLWCLALYWQPHRRRRSGSGPHCLIRNTEELEEKGCVRSDRRDLAKLWKEQTVANSQIWQPMSAVTIGPAKISRLYLVRWLTSVSSNQEQPPRLHRKRSSMLQEGGMGMLNVHQRSEIFTFALPIDQNNNGCRIILIWTPEVYVSRSKCCS